MEFAALFGPHLNQRLVPDHLGMEIQAVCSALARLPVASRSSAPTQTWHDVRSVESHEKGGEERASSAPAGRLDRTPRSE